MLLAIAFAVPGASPAHAQHIDTEHLFGFMIGTDVGDLGDREIEAETLALMQGATQFDITLTMAEVAGELRGTLEYDAGPARIQENELINQIRGRVALWRQRGRAGVTRTTARLLEHWTHAERERPLFFCQIEALETAIYLTEVASKYGDAWIENQLREANETGGNPELFRSVQRRSKQSSPS